MIVVLDGSNRRRLALQAAQIASSAAELKGRHGTHKCISRS